MQNICETGVLNIFGQMHCPPGQPKQRPFWTKVAEEPQTTEISNIGPPKKRSEVIRLLTTTNRGILSIAQDAHLGNPRQGEYFCKAGFHENSGVTLGFIGELKNTQRGSFGIALDVHLGNP